MQLNKSTDYAIRLLICLAETPVPVPSSKLAVEVGVSQLYLLQIGAKLREAGFIKTAHGPTGGYVLTRCPEEISLYDIITVMEGMYWNIHAKSEGTLLPLHAAYSQLEDMVKQHLCSITLNDLQN